MKTIFKYLQPATTKNAATAVTYYPNLANRLPVYNCCYNYYDPVKGYTLSYHPWAFTSCSKKIQHYFISISRREQVFILCRY